MISAASAWAAMGDRLWQRHRLHHLQCGAGGGRSTIAVRPGKADAAALRLPAGLLLCGGGLLRGGGIHHRMFSRWVGIVLLGDVRAYMAAQVAAARRAPAAPASGEAAEESAGGSLAVELVRLVLSAALIALGANLMVDNGVVIAAGLGVPESVIALTVVALGTSLPELVTAITSLVKGHGALSLGNVIGANLFNLVLVNGVSVALAPFGLPEGSTLAGYNASLVLDLPVAFLVMVLLVGAPLWKGRLYRWQGVTLLALYAAYCAVQFTL